MRRFTILLVGATLAVAGCGGDDEEPASGGSSESTPTATATEPASGGGENLALAADAGALKFDKSELTAPAGKVTITMDNPSDVPHAVEVEGNGVEEETKTLTGGTADVTVDLKAGKYEFYCPVDGHRQAGMEGTLTVG